MVVLKINPQRPFGRLMTGLAIAVSVFGVAIPTAEGIVPEVEPGMYCQLSSAEMAERLGEIRADFLVAVRNVNELENGYRYSFEKSADRMKRLAEFIDFESRCCAFMRFDLSVTPGAQEISLSLTGAEGTKELLESMMISAEFDWRAGASDDAGAPAGESAGTLTSEVVACFRQLIGE